MREVSDARPGQAVGWLRAHRAILALTTAAFAIRGWIVLRRSTRLVGDPLYYHWQAQLVARGKGFLQPADFKYMGTKAPGADHPPLHTVWLALWSVLRLDSTRWHLLAGAVMGAATVALVFATADLVANRRTAIVAGVMAAMWPNLVFWSAGGYAESTASMCVALFTFLAVRYLDRPSMGRLVATATAATLAGLARSELILLLVALVPLVLVADPLRRVDRLRWLGAALAVSALLVAPWAIYNQTRFEKPVPLSTGLGLVLVSSNCDEAYYGSSIGYWWFGCSSSGETAARTAGAADRSVADARMRVVAERYVSEHEARLPAVASARIGRMFGVFQPRNSVRLAESGEGLDTWIAGAITTTWWAAMGLGIGGAVVLRRRGRHLTPFLAPVLVIAGTAIVSYGIVRFRAPAEPAVLVLAAIAVDALLARLGPDPA